MAAKQRIRKLAKRLGRKPQEIIDVLHNLGETRYRSPSDMLSMEVTRRVERALELAGLVPEPKPPREEEPAPSEPAPPPPMPRAWMPKPKPRAAEPGAAAEPAPEPASEASAPTEVSAPDTPADAPVVAEPEPAPEAVGAESEPEPEPEPEPELPEEVAPKVAELAARVEELEGNLAAARKTEAEAVALQKVAIDRLAPSEMRVRELEKELADATKEAERQVNLLQHQLNRASAALDAVQIDELGPVMEQRGVDDPAEMGSVLATLLGGEWHAKALEHLRLVESERFSKLLKQKVLLWSGDPSDVPPTDRVPVVVTPASRCEVNGGSRLLPLAEKLVTKLRAKNVRRLNLVGGSERDAKELMRGMSGRIDVRWIGPTQQRTESQAEEEVEGAHLTVLWSCKDLPYRLAAAYLGKDRVLMVNADGLTGFLKELEKAL